MNEMTEYETIIGLEVHVELLTKSKVFCGCSTAFGAGANTQTCPVCLGLPGVLPVLNKKAVEFAMRAALALNSEVASFSKFDRKNYFYPDLPKNFQISQYDLPLASGGYVDIQVNGSGGDSSQAEPQAGIRRIRIKRVHLEEDTGKSVHEGASITGSDFSLEDYNRTGVPLLEIVSEPDIRSPEEAKAYLERLKAILQYVEISDCKMEEGSLRCDANVSIRPKGASGLGVKTEIKNLNSFRSVQRSLEFEVDRQRKVVERGERVVQDTRHWDDAKGVTVSMRSKEQAHDYRYFPEPDLAPMVIDRTWVEEIRRSLPELPDARKERFVCEYGIPEYDAALITGSKRLADFFDACARGYRDPKVVSNWVMGELLRLLNVHNQEIEDARLTPEHLTGMIELIDEGVISGKIAKTVFEEMFETGKPARVIVEEHGLVQISDEGQILGIVDRVIAENPSVVADFRAGKEKALGFLVGQVMKHTQGKANPQAVNRLLRERLGGAEAG